MSTPEVKVLTVDLSKPGHVTLTPLLHTRIREFAAERDEWVHPEVFAASVMARLWERDPRLLVLVLVTESEVVGHVVAQLQDEGKPVVLVIQTKADRDVGHALIEAMHLTEQWARSQGAVSLIAVTHRDPDAMARRFGFKLSRHLLTKPLTEGA